ncbi:hypothetical protein J7K18_02920 [bacterium]|nr:hypothetical protein [bacterium]
MRYGLILLILLSGAVYGMDISPSPDMTLSEFRESLSPSVQDEMLLTQQWGKDTLSEGKIFAEEKPLSISRALGYSLLLPGAGELYTKSYIQAASFLLLEAGLWTGHFYYHSQGKKKEKEYKEFADRWWSEALYWEWYYSLGEDTSAAVEHLPSTKNQQYYEMIGKYNWFVMGWIDAQDSSWYGDPDVSNIEEPNRTTDKREEYLRMRKRSNDMLKLATYSVAGVIVNHLLSALDAAITAKISNEKMFKGFTDATIRTQTAYKNNEVTHSVFLTVNFN